QVDEHGRARSRRASGEFSRGKGRLSSTTPQIPVAAFFDFIAGLPSVRFLVPMNKRILALLSGFLVFSLTLCVASAQPATPAGAETSAVSGAAPAAQAAPG